VPGWLRPIFARENPLFSLRSDHMTMSAGGSFGTGWPLAFALCALATWRLTHLLVEEDGPADAVLRLRRAAGPGVLGQAMDCFYCASVWVALPVAVGLTRDPSVRAPWRRPGPSSRVAWPRCVVTWLALSGAACLLEQATRPDGASDLAGGADTRAGEPAPAGELGVVRARHVASGAVA
jgi:hypothetical protein